MQKFYESRMGKNKPEAPTGPGRFSDEEMQDKHRYDKAPSQKAPAESGLRDQFGKPVKIDKIA